MIVCVEDAGKTLWIDPTARHCAFLSLPWQDQGVRALVIKPKGSYLATTPTSTAFDNRVQTKWDVTLDADGGFTAHVDERISGQEGCFFRDAFGPVAPDKHADFFQQQVAHTFPQAQVTGCQWDNLKQVDEPLALSYQFAAPNSLQKAGDLLLFPLPFRTDIPPLPQKERVHPIVFDYPFHRVQQMTLHLPAGYTVVELPEPVEVKTQWGQVQLSATTAQDRVTARFEMLLNTTDLPAGESETLRHFQQEVVACGQKHIILKQRAVSP